MAQNRGATSAPPSSAATCRCRPWPRRRLPGGAVHLAALCPTPTTLWKSAIDAQTMEIHHDRHHAAYVAGLNTAVAGNAALAARPIEQILRGINDVAVVPAAIKQAVTNQRRRPLQPFDVLADHGRPNAGGNSDRRACSKPSTPRFTNFDTFKTAFRPPPWAVSAAAGPGWSTPTIAWKSSAPPTRIARS